MATARNRSDREQQHDGDAARDGDPRSCALIVHAPLLASRIFGAPVAVDGASERLVISEWSREGDSWRIAAVRTHRGDAALRPWSPEALLGDRRGGAVEATWLREALFDRQIVDLEGRRVIRVGDVVLRADEGAARGRGGGGRRRSGPAASRASRGSPRGSSRSCSRSTGCTCRARRRARCSSTRRGSSSRNWSPRP